MIGRFILLWLMVASATCHLSAATRPAAYGIVPGYRAVAYGNGVDLFQSTAWRGREVDVAGYYHLGLRDYDPVSGQWLSYDPMWNEGDPNGQSFCGGDPVNGFDPNGKCTQNAPNALYVGIVPGMAQYTETTTYLQNGTKFSTGLPNEPDQVYPTSQVAAQTYNQVTMPTGQYYYYSSANPLPDNYGQTTSKPVTQADVESQQDVTFLKLAGTGLAWLASDGLAADGEAVVADAAIANPVPSNLVRVIPGEGPFTTLAPPTSVDAFVTDPAAIQGMTPAQIGPRLGIPASDTYTIFQFPTPSEGLASPVFRPNPGFIGGGKTTGFAPEFVIPNGPIPTGATKTIIRSQ